MAITPPNQVWAADITYIPMAEGFLYLVAIMDWYTRYVVAWSLSNTDQGSRFTSEGFTGLLAQHGVRISMDGKGRFVGPRHWRVHGSPRLTTSVEKDSGIPVDGR